MSLCTLKLAVLKCRGPFAALLAAVRSPSFIPLWWMGLQDAFVLSRVRRRVVWICPWQPPDTSFSPCPSLCCVLGNSGVEAHQKPTMESDTYPSKIVFCVRIIAGWVGEVGEGNGQVDWDQKQLQPPVPFSWCLKKVPKKEGENKTTEAPPQTLTACNSLQFKGCQGQAWLLWMQSCWANFCESVQFLPD